MSSEYQTQSALQAAGGRARNLKMRVPVEIVEKATELRAQGLSWALISERLGWSDRAIRKWASGGKKREDFWSDAEVAKARELISRGYRYEDVAKLLGRSKHAIRNQMRYQRLHERGFSSRSPLAGRAVPTSEMLAECEYAYQSQTIDQLIFGDPPRGRSALDKR